MAAATLVQSALFKSEQNVQAFSGSLIQHPASFLCRNGCNLTNGYSRNYRRAPLLKVSCTSQEEPKLQNTDDVSKPPSSSSKADPVIGSTNYASTPISTPKKVSTKFSDIFSFSGPAPETINGRLAMVGFVSALGVEIATGQGLLGQLGNGGFRWFVEAAIIFTLASLFPLFQGISVESKSKSFFSSKAETWNGRAAMVGLVALALTEYVKGGPLF